MVSVDYATSPGTATSGSDYQPISDTVQVYLPVEGSHDEPVDVPIHDDTEDSAVVESAQVTLSNATATGGATPSFGIASAPILIVDADGVNRVGFEGIPYGQSETFPVAKIPVFWAGTGSAPSVQYTVEPGPNNPASPGDDYTVTSPPLLSFGSERFATIDLSVVNDQLEEGPEDVTITLTGAMGAAVATATTTFTIEDNEENVPPLTRFHHPKHKKKYRKNDYKIREWHVFYSDEGGSGVVAVEVALRQNLKGGKCRWLTNGGWKRRDCSDRAWLTTKYDSFVDWYVKRMRQLKPSVKTKIKSYTAFARAIDGAGNVEKDFIKKRNDNTFEIQRSKRKRR
jgi:hypothetical protein